MLSLSDMAVHRRLVKLNLRRRTPAEARFTKRLRIPDELMAKVAELRKAREVRLKNIESTNAIKKCREADQ
jgi:hypothetical protein